MPKDIIDFLCKWASGDLQAHFLKNMLLVSICQRREAHLLDENCDLYANRGRSLEKVNDFSCEWVPGDPQAPLLNEITKQIGSWGYLGSLT